MPKESKEGFYNLWTKVVDLSVCVETRLSVKIIVCYTIGCLGPTGTFAHTASNLRVCWAVVTKFEGLAP